jgi:hypothetical protein
VQRRILAQDRLLQLAQLAAGLQAAFLDERAPELRVGRERLGLAPRAVQREHQLRAQALAQRVAAGDGRELTRQLGVTAALEVGIDPGLERIEPQLVEIADRLLGERLGLEVRQRSTAPQPERLPEHLGRRCRLARVQPPAARGDQLLEAQQIELGGADPDRVSG